MMRNIRLVLTNDVEKCTFEGEELEIYKFDKNESTLEKLKEIVFAINKNQNEMVYFITNEKNLFEFFNRRIICEYHDVENNKNSILPIEFILNYNQYFTELYYQVRDIFFDNIMNVLNNYGNIFNIDIEKLTKGTTYKVTNKYDLINLLNEDLNLISFKQILTSRLAIVFYRLTYFDYDASKVSIGRFFSDYYEKSESFKMNLNRNSSNWFFTDLNNKIFRGYKIKFEKSAVVPSDFDLKIKIARKLLSNNIKLKIVAEAIEMKEEELKEIIYNQQLSIYRPNIDNSSGYKPNGNYVPRFGPNEYHTPK
jgi:hypothetical protein